MRKQGEDSIFNKGLDRGGKMKRLSGFMVGAKGFTLVGLFALTILAACDDHISVAPREDDTLLSVCDGCVSSSSIAQMSNSSETVLPSSSAELDSPAEPGSSAESGSSSSVVQKPSSGGNKETPARSSSSSVSLASSSSENEAVSSSRGTEDIILPSTVDPEILVIATPCRTGSTDSCEYGTLTDERDGQTYKTVKLGNLWWMAENLNYAYLQPVADMDSGSFCFNDSLEYCEKYGRLYPWAIALGICPSGWHLPWFEEYKTLMRGFYYMEGKGFQSTEWEKGTDIYGFSALPSGGRYSFNGSYTLGYTGTFNGEPTEPAIFWTDTKVVRDTISTFTYYFEDESALTFSVHASGGSSIRTADVNDAYSVRCVKDY